jgi:hypothetical protein
MSPTCTLAIMYVLGNTINMGYFFQSQEYAFSRILLYFVISAVVLAVVWISIFVLCAYMVLWVSHVSTKPQGSPINVFRYDTLYWGGPCLLFPVNIFYYFLFFECFGSLFLSFVCLGFPVLPSFCSTQETLKLNGPLLYGVVLCLCGESCKILNIIAVSTVQSDTQW